MCNHYVEPDAIVIDWVTTSYPSLTREGDVEAVPYEKWPKYNGHFIYAHGGQRAVAVGRWGVRGVDEDGKTVFATNAKAESILGGRPIWRESRHSRRCLVPASAYFEPGIGPPGARGELRFTIKGREWFFMAGLWEPDALDNNRFSYAIVTTEPNTYAARFHDRMPVVLSDEDALRWLGDEPLPRDTIKALLQHPPVEWMDHTVIPAVPREKKTKASTADSPVAPMGQAQGELF